MCACKRVPPMASAGQWLVPVISAPAPACLPSYRPLHGRRWRAASSTPAAKRLVDGRRRRGRRWAASSPPPPRQLGAASAAAHAARCGEKAGVAPGKAGGDVGPSMRPAAVTLAPPIGTGRGARTDAGAARQIVAGPPPPPPLRGRSRAGRRARRSRRLPGAVVLIPAARPQQTRPPLRWSAGRSPPRLSVAAAAVGRASVADSQQPRVHARWPAAVAVAAVVVAAAAAVGDETAIGGGAPALAAGAPLVPCQRCSTAAARGNCWQMTAPPRRHRLRLCTAAVVVVGPPRADGDPSASTPRRAVVNAWR